MIKPFYQVVIEGIVVGQLLIWMYYITKSLIVPNLIPIVNFTNNEAAIVFLSGFMFHLICEFTNINLWYVQNYYNILKKINKHFN